MKNLKSVLSFFLTASILIALFCPITAAGGAEGSAGPIIADHSNATLAKLEAIPVEWINKAKSDLHIYFNHTSHGSQIPTGMTGLVNFRGSQYAWNSSGSNGALHLADTYSTDLGDADWPNITRNYLNSHPNINVVMWSWCGQVSGSTEAYINTYLNNMSQLEREYPNVKFVYMTGHTDGTGESGSLHRRNEQIRQYCRTNNKILFDFADIESHDPDGNYYMNKAVNDNCDYDSDGNGSRDKNWATVWQNSHTRNVDWFDCDPAHTQALNGNMKAYTAWYLWARLAGWDGGTQGTTQPTTSVSQLTARHYNGQTILTWNEIPEVTAAIPGTMTPQQVKDLRSSFNNITYRIYRSTSPITSVTGLSPIKTVTTLSGWDDEFYGRENNNVSTQNCPRFVVVKDTNNIAAAPVSANTAVSAYNPAAAGTAYYAVTVVRNSVEEKLIGSGNTVMVNETVGQGIPILQKVETQTDYFYTQGISTHYYYTRWESPPNSNVQGMPHDYKVIVPQSYQQGTPAPVYMSFHGWSSSMHSISAWWLNYSKGTIVITSNENPYDWWTGYHEKYGIGERSQQNWSSGVVRPYTQNRLNSFYDWAATKWSFDRSRTISGGVSMGGSGSVMYGIRNPDRIAWVYSWVGVHVPAESPTFRSSYQGVYGELEWQIKYEDGITPAFSFYDDDWYLRNHISDETPFITFSNGKNDGSIGWSQAVKFVNALQDTKRPHIFYWGQGGHNQRTLNPPDINGISSESANPIDIRTNQSLPAFTKCSLDDKPGNGSTNNGDASGQINAYMFWKTEDIVDTQSRWEMTVGAVQTAPAQSCTVSLTPRRLQNFDPTPGEVYRWSNTSLSNNTRIQSGTVTADANGLITIDNLTVNRITSAGGGNRIVIYSDDGTVPANNPPVLAGEISTFEEGKTPTSIIHVATNGNDSTGNGSAASPFRSINRALQAAAPGTAIRIHPGTYSGRINISGLSGTAQAPIWIGGVPGEAKPVITSSTEGIHLTRVRYLILHDLEISNTSENAINCDDGSEYNNIDATRYLIFRDLYIHDVNTSGNEDGIKLSGVNDYYILDCEITRCGNNYGSGIDHVGCHNGIIAGNYLHDFAGTGITSKGGSENIHIRGNRLFDCGERAVNIGGSTDFAFFRPPLSTTQPNYEAKNIHVYSNLMRGSIAPIAFVGATSCSAVNNTVISPENWLIRILQERTSTSQYIFGPCANNTVANNIFYYNGSALSQYGTINVGNNTSPATFTFSNNLWYNYNSPQNSTPNLPVTETGGIFGQDPLFTNLADNNISLHTSSPAVGRGVSNETALYDYNGVPFGSPRNIGAVAGSSSAVQNQPPVLASIGAKTVNEGANLSFTINATDRDQGETLTYSISPVSPSTLPAGISFNSTTRVFSWTPGDEQSGTYTLRFTVSDGKQIDYEDVVITVMNMSNTTPQGRNVRVTSAAELRSAITNAQNGDTILIANGDYTNGNPLILNNVDNISIRSESNDPTKVTLRGRSRFTGTGSYDELDDILRIGDCNNVHISGLTLTQAHGYGIKLELDGNSNPNAIYIENCRFIDIGTRHIKGTKDSNSSTKRITGGAIRNCYFENTVTPPSTGGWRFDGNYVGAIDMMSLDGWVIEDNEFRNIHGISGEGRSAIMIWHYSEDLTIQRNRIINCDRGITLGLPGSDLGGGRHVKDAIVRNNFILPGSRAGYQSDAGIECSDVDNVKIYNNTIWRLKNDYNGRGIRFIQNIANTQMVNNLVYGRLVFDNNLTISRNENNLSGNLSSGYVVNVSSGDLHLTSSAVDALNKGVLLAEVTEDIDGNARGTTPDIGADEYIAPSGGNTNPGGGTTNPGGGNTNPGGGIILPPPPGGDNTTDTPTDTSTTTPATTIVSVTQSVVVSGGTAKAATSVEQLSSAINQAAPDNDGVRSIALTLPEVRQAGTYLQEIPAEAFRKGTEKERYEIITPLASISIPGNMFPAGEVNKPQNMGISVSYADKSQIKKNLAEKIGDRPVLQITAYADDKKIEWNNKKAPVTITVDYTPTEKELKNPDHIVVWYIDGKGNIIPVTNSRYDPVTKKVTFKLTHFSDYVIAYSEKTYSDIGKAYAKAEIEALASKGFYEWITGSSFAPDRNITRGEFLYLLVTLLDLQDTVEENFSDVKSTDFYYEAAGIAKKYGISNGIGSNKLGAEQSITRQDMSTMIVRALNAADRKYPAGSISDLNQFKDTGKISSYAKESLMALVKAGILKGYHP